jgi:hypothetical protein
MTQTCPRWYGIAGQAYRKGSHCAGPGRKFATRTDAQWPRSRSSRAPFRCGGASRHLTVSSLRLPLGESLRNPWVLHEERVANNRAAARPANLPWQQEGD